MLAISGFVVQRNDCLGVILTSSSTGASQADMTAITLQSKIEIQYIPACSTCCPGHHAPAALATPAVSVILPMIQSVLPELNL